MTQNQSISIVKNIFHITYIRNTGAAFGIFKNYQSLLIFLSVIFIVFILFYFAHVGWQDLITKISLAAIIGGSLGNLSDRIVRGYVVDFIDVRFFSIFNFADIMINVGVFLLVFKFLFYKEGR